MSIFSVAHAFSSALLGSSLLQYVSVVAIVVLLFRLEATRREGKSKLPLRSNVSMNSAGFLASTMKTLEQYAPEIIGLAVCLVMAVALRMNDANDDLQETIDDHSHPEVLDKVKTTWPILLTADTLLGLQAMLRLLVLVSSVLRAERGPLLLSQEAALISCAAMVARVFLAAHMKVYRLDGPLGGFLPMACDLVSAPLLAILSSSITKQGVAASGAALAAAAFIGSHNYLNLANEHLADGLFIFVHTAELFAAIAYISRALSSDDGAGSVGRRSVALWFAHIVMPVQSSLSAYYFVAAFVTVPQMVAAGFPFAILHMGGMAQVAAYAGASVLHFAQYHEAKELAPLSSQEPCKAASVDFGEVQLTPRGVPTVIAAGVP